MTIIQINVNFLRKTTMKQKSSIHRMKKKTFLQEFTIAYMASESLTFYLSLSFCLRFEHLKGPMYKIYWGLLAKISTTYV